MQKKSTLCKKIKSLILENISNTEEIKNRISVLKTTHNMPISISSDILTLRTELADQTDFVLFCIAELLDDRLLNNYFSDIEIGRYSKEKFKIDKVKFPLRINALKISDSQWIGSITVRELMKLRDAQLIRYNENAQRTLTKVINGDKEYYKITLNKSAVSAIADLMKSGTYISNTLTLNMPEETSFKYDNGELIIDSISAFDILDGYHRYMAISSIVNDNPQFDYTMELRIVCFSDEKARHFIWQEDQKTKMRKLDSDAMNQNNPANQIVEMLNQSCGILTGQINKNGGIIDSAVLSKLIYMTVFNTVAKVSRKDIISIKNSLKSDLTTLVDNMPELLDSSWSNKFILCFVICSTNNCMDKLFNLFNATAELPLANYNSTEINRYKRTLNNV